MDYKYKAFISYSHASRDAEIARFLHTMLERYSVPRERRRQGPGRIGKIFRDEEELAVTHDLSQALRAALDESEFLIVICSPNAVQSEWVHQEIELFTKNHGRDKVLAVIAGGDPKEVLGQLLPAYAEPLFIDLSEGEGGALRRNLKNNLLKLCAPLLGCGYDDLVMRDQKRRRRRFWYWAGGISLVAMTIISILLWSNLKIEAKNRELERQNQEILLRESEALVNVARDQLAAGDRAAALKTVLQVLKGAGNQQFYYAPAEEVMISALGFFEDGQPDPLIPKRTLKHLNPVSDFCLSPDGSQLFLTDINDDVVCFDTDTGNLRWEQRAFAGQLRSPTELYSSPYSEATRAGDKKIIACGDRLLIHDFMYSVVSMAQQTGEVCWRYSGQLHPWGTIYVSADQSTVACIERRDDTWNAVFVEISTGTVLDTIPITDEAYWNTLEQPPSQSLRGEMSDFAPGGCLSSDGMLFAGSFVEAYEDGSTALCYYVADRAADTCRVISRQKMEGDGNAFGVCMDFTDQDRALTVFRTNGDESFAYTVEKLDPSDGSCLWCTQTPSDAAYDFRHIYQVPRLYLAGHIILSAGEHLYCIAPEDGTLKACVILEDDVLDLFAAGEEAFTVILHNGTYTRYSLRADGIGEEGTSFALGSVVQAASTQYGLTLPGEGNADVRDSRRFIATVPAERPYHIELHRLVATDTIHDEVDMGLHISEFAPSRVFCLYPDDNTVLLGEGVVFNEDAHLGDTLSSMYRGLSYVRIDARTNQVLDMVEIATVEHKICWLPDYEMHLLYDDIGNLFLYDPSIEGYRVLSESHMPVMDETGQTTYESQNLLSDAAVRSSDQTVIAFVCNGDAALYVELPDLENGYIMHVALPQTVPDDAAYGLIAGENGFAAVPYSEYEDQRWAGCAFYDSLEEEWYCFDSDEGYHDFWLAREKELAVGLSVNGYLNVIDIRTGEIVGQIPWSLPHSSMGSLRFIMEDRFILLQTQAGQINIYDISSGNCVYTEWVEDSVSLDRLYCAEDPVNQRLYIRKIYRYFEPESASCIDTRTWVKIAEIPGFVAFDWRYNTIYRMQGDFYGDRQLMACRLPGTEALTAIADQLLG